MASSNVKEFRSITGCCICRAKSSSSRFTSSARYEEYFSGCFGTGTEKRSGDLCNPCVLCVKRYKKLPFGSEKNWAHKKDEAIRPGRKATNKISRLRNVWNQLSYTDPVVRQRSSQILNTSVKLMTSPYPLAANKHTFGSRRRRFNLPKRCQSSRFTSHNQLIDEHYWKRANVCCGTIFQGLCGDFLLDLAHYRPCVGHAMQPQLATVVRNDDTTVTATSALSSETQWEDQDSGCAITMDSLSSTPEQSVADDTLAAASSFCRDLLPVSDDQVVDYIAAERYATLKMSQRLEIAV